MVVGCNMFHVEQFSWISNKKFKNYLICWPLYIGMGYIIICI